MTESNKIKLLDNYQLHQLIENQSIDKSTLEKLKTEFNARNLSENEKNRLRNKYQLNHSKFGSEIEKNNWSPLFTAFALNRHFRHLALLKTQGKKKEAEKYMIELYFGLALYFALIILLILVLKSK